MSIKMFLNWYVIGYFIIIIIVHCSFLCISRINKIIIRNRRKKATLTHHILMNTSANIKLEKKFMIRHVTILLCAIILTPLFFINQYAELSYEKQGLFYSLILLILMIMYHGTNIFKAFFTGFAFKVLTILKSTIHVGDRVTLKGITGKLTEIDSFYVTLQTIDDDLVHIPTASLWSENILNINGGEGGSLTVLNFYINPTDIEQYKKAETAIWNSMQASVYIDFTKPMQIYISQKPFAIQLTAKAYVASTYNELSFQSDITKAFLEVAKTEKISLSFFPNQQLEE